MEFTSLELCFVWFYVKLHHGPKLNINERGPIDDLKLIQMFHFVLVVKSFCNRIIQLDTITYKLYC